MVWIKFALLSLSLYLSIILLLTSFETRDYPKVEVPLYIYEDLKRVKPLFISIKKEYGIEDSDIEESYRSSGIISAEEEE